MGTEAKKMKVGDLIAAFFCSLFGGGAGYAWWKAINERNSPEAIAKRQQQARGLLRNYRIEWRARNGFLAHGSQRELILRDKPLTDPELDVLMQSVNVNDILKTEIE